MGLRQVLPVHKNRIFIPFHGITIFGKMKAKNSGNRMASPKKIGNFAKMGFFARHFAQKLGFLPDK